MQEAASRPSSLARAAFVPSHSFANIAEYLGMLNKRIPHCVLLCFSAHSDTCYIELSLWLITSTCCRNCFQVLNIVLENLLIFELGLSGLGGFSSSSIAFLYLELDFFLGYFLRASLIFFHIDIVMLHYDNYSFFICHVLSTFFFAAQQTRMHS
jgi:hypothetical protein